MDKEFLERFIPNLAKLLGNKCEVVLHDFTGGLEHTIRCIENGHVTGRQVGDGPTSLFFENYSLEQHQDSPYFVHTTKGRILKAVSTFLYDQERTPVGALCINMDITDLVLAQNALGSFAAYKEEHAASEVFANDVQELLELYISQCQELIGKPGSLMNKEEKVRALGFLDSKGVFLISKANVRLCAFFDISKYTLYNYLEESRNNKS